MRRFPSISFAALLVLSFFGARFASAQAAYTATGPGGYLAAGGTYSYFQSEYGQQKLGGAGVHAEFNFTRSLGLEAEVRWLRQNQVANTHETTYLVGPRFQVRLRRGHFMPYAKFLVGDGEFNFPYNYATDSVLVLAPGAGLEYRVNDRLAIRLLDVEYQRWTNFTYSNSIPGTTITPYGVSFGITYRIMNFTRPGYRHY